MSTDCEWCPLLRHWMGGIDGPWSQPFCAFWSLVPMRYLDALVPGLGNGPWSREPHSESHFYRFSLKKTHPYSPHIPLCASPGDVPSPGVPPPGVNRVKMHIWGTYDDFLLWRDLMMLWDLMENHDTYTYYECENDISEGEYTPLSFPDIIHTHALFSVGD